MSESAFDQGEELGEADQGDVVVPAGPAAQFVIGQAKFSFGFLDNYLQKQDLSFLPVTLNATLGVKGIVGLTKQPLLRLPR